MNEPIRRLCGTPPGYPPNQCRVNAFNGPHSRAQRNAEGISLSSDSSPSARDRARALLVLVGILSSAALAASLMWHKTGGAAVAVAVLLLVVIVWLVARNQHRI